MILTSILLQHFRSYTQQKFDFDNGFTVIIGPNTAGKTNLSEAVNLLLIGKSFRTSSEIDMIEFGQEVARVQGLLEENLNDKLKLEVAIASPQVTGGRFSKKFLMNGVPKLRSAFFGLLPLVLFRPEELEIIIDGPSLRRNFLDTVLEQTDKIYANANRTYERSLRQRNALLRAAQETGNRNAEQFAYWDDLLIENGQILTQKRSEFLDFVNKADQTIFYLQTTYDKSTISRERLDEYQVAETGAGVTLVGPHRDDFFVTMKVGKEEKDIRHFGSRGQQRLAVLQLKMLQIEYIVEKVGKRPLLVLDDIFSELDNSHIQLVLDNVQKSQSILTTTHKEFVPQALLKSATVIELEK
ncbi:MAG TPA: DNA replication and repair protein RecF [Patescibacteria group bacterium]